MGRRALPTPGSTTTTCTVPRGKRAVRLRDQKGAFVDLEGPHLVADVHQLRARADAQNHAFHGAHVVVGKAEIRGQSKDGLPHC